MRSFTFRTADGYLDSIDTCDRAASIEEARQKAEQWILDFDYGNVDETFWMDVDIYDDAEDNGDYERLTVTIHPDEPDCLEGEHRWESPHCIFGGLKENPGVFGNGGGVIIKELCSNCGRYRITDTWAQRADTGEQGLKSIHYREADEESSAWVEECKSDE